MDDREEDTRANDEDPGVSVPPNKRQNRGETNEAANEYDSPDEAVVGKDTPMTEEQAAQLRDTVSYSITESAKVLPIHKHK